MVQMPLRITERQKQELKRESERLSVPEAEVIRRILDAWIDGPRTPRLASLERRVEAIAVHLGVQ